MNFYIKGGCSPIRYGLELRVLLTAETNIIMRRFCFQEMEARKSSSAVTSTVSNRLRFQLRLNAQARQSLGAEDAAETTTMTPPVASGKNKRKSQSDPSYNPAGVKQRAVGAGVGREGAAIATSRNRRKGGRTPKYRESYVHYENGASSDDDENDNDDEVTDGGIGGGHVKREVDHVTEMLIKKDEDGDGDAQLLNTDGGSVQVKEEPVDAGYEQASDSHTLSSSSASASSSSNAALSLDIKPFSSSSSRSCANLRRNSPSPNSKSMPVATTKASSNSTATAATSNSNTNVREVTKRLKDSKPHGGRVSPLGGSSSTSGQTINSVADLLRTRRELSETCTRLIETQTQNINLETRLEDAHKEIAYLRDTLRTRELQITNLANSFFDLSNQFMRASNEFKQVMQSIQPSGDQYVAPQL